MSEEIALAAADLATVEGLHAALSEATRRIVLLEAQLDAVVAAAVRYNRRPYGVENGMLRNALDDAIRAAGGQDGG